MKMRSRSHSAGTRASRALGTAWLLIGLMGLTCMPAAAAGAVGLGVPGALSLLPSQPGSPAVRLFETRTPPTSISSYSGWSAWSRYDSTHRAYQLMVRNANGEVTAMGIADRKSTRLNSSHLGISYAVFCLKK